MTRSPFLAARRRDERGAYAVMFALLATSLFGLAALGVDLGNVYQRKAETQSQADLAATSAAARLPVSQAAAVQAAADYLNHNRTLGQSPITTAQLTDGATYFHTPSVRPSWARRFELTAKIGRHSFYRAPIPTAMN